MKIEKLNLDGKKDTIEILDSVFQLRFIKNLFTMFYINQMQITKEGKLKQNKKMK